jgi:hypothetical protein
MICYRGFQLNEEKLMKKLMELLTELRHGNPMAEKYWEQFMMKLRRNGLKDSILTIERGRLTGDKRIIFPKGLNVGIGT